MMQSSHYREVEGSWLNILKCHSAEMLPNRVTFYPSTFSHFIQLFYRTFCKLYLEELCTQQINFQWIRT